MALNVITGPTIAAGESLSNAVNFGNGDLVRLNMPSEWTPANITFQVSADGINFRDVFDRVGREVIVAVVVNATIPILDADWTKSISQIKFRSGTRNYPVVQAVEREFSCVVATGN